MDIALLVLRVIFGLLFIGHGAQKLLGWFGGDGMGGTARWLGSMNLRPASLWAVAAGASEFVGGLLLALGLFNPLGALAVIAAMVAAALLVHAPNGVWATNGGYELPLVLGTGAAVLVLAGPGTYSLDALLGLALPPAVAILAGVGVVASIAYLLLSRRAASEGRFAGEAKGKIWS